MEISQERHIPARDFPQDPIRCPECQKQNLTLYGTLEKDYKETWESGENVDSTVGDTVVHQVTGIDCNDCGIRFHILTTEMSELLNQNQILSSKLASLTGVDATC
jgi:hypothetical protein